MSGEPLAPVPEDERLRRAKELGDDVTPETEETQEDPEPESEAPD